MSIFACGSSITLRDWYIQIDVIFDAIFVIYALITSLMGIKSFDLLFILDAFQFEIASQRAIMSRCDGEILDVRQVRRGRLAKDRCNYYYAHIFFPQHFSFEHITNTKKFHCVTQCNRLFLDQLFWLFEHFVLPAHGICRCKHICFYFHLDGVCHVMRRFTIWITQF